MRLHIVIFNLNRRSTYDFDDWKPSILVSKHLSVWLTGGRFGLLSRTSQTVLLYRVLDQKNPSEASCRLLRSFCRKIISNY
ncbi:hypothetical protein MTR_5g089835 [Medicago truncatula]|uniref:Uncharacterized protein n=1 Tax=Medicago truncatula TaxID=3880 RepID=A0A072UR99_MEDTR|nr:hypothetical protein MTR_5g089835 [Medicago truncatula]